ncbi:hypothetical protein ACQKNS_24410 [Peribacillus sp. NPDC094092]|uniref:hypothetical protein n=1 Tax=Peribacillus sp. NPDC094092 TaxID=3390611 RepID=UPI003CFDF5DD
MVLGNPERYNFYKLENELKKGKDKFIKYLDEILISNGVDSVITSLKASGLSVNFFNNSKHKSLFNEILNHILIQLESDDIKKIEDFRRETLIFDLVFKQFDQLRTSFFDKYETIDDKYKVVSYLISLELYLKGLTDKSFIFGENALVDVSKKNKNNYREKSALFDSAIESTGMILKYFMHKENEFKGSKRNISPRILDASLTHVTFSEYWYQLNDILEYWKYSDVNVSVKDDGKVFFEIVDDKFELNNLISNERFNNLRQGWQMSEIGEMQKMHYGRNDTPFDTILPQITTRLNYLFSTLYFGSPLLEEKINRIEIKQWIRAYQILIDESKRFLKRQRTLNVYNLDKVCISKSIYKWKKFFQQNGFSIEESETIIEYFTFDKKSLDLIDCPFVKIDDSLIILPSLTSQADASRALASNFLNKNINLDFKGIGFEERSKVGLEMNGIKNSGLYKKIDKTEYECDIAFILNNDLVFVECKAHVQPYTTRQHASHLYKLYKETSQLNRIADFFEENLSIVREQLKLDEGFVPNKVHRILLTTSMIGTPLYVNGVHIIDESSFTMFIDRVPPSLEYFEKGSYIKYPSTKFDIYKGELTAQKMKDFLSSPPQIKITEELYQQKELSLDFFDFRRNLKVNHTLNIGVNLNDFDRSLIEQYY